MKINLMPPAPPIVRIRIIVFTTIVGVLSASCVYFGATYYGDTISLRSAQTTLSEEQLILQSLLAKSQQVKQTTGLQQLLQETRSIASSAPTPEEDIQSLLATVPASGQLTTVSFAAGQMAGTVLAPSYAVAAQFIARLQSNRTFANVIVASITGSGGAQSALTQAQTLGSLANAPKLANQSGVEVTFTMTPSTSVSGASVQGGNP
ncbi:MAG: hypothetical protein ACYCYO_06285 [Bacilli bacterium]